ncbi:MAG: flagellar hook-length control protein FliK, partial [Planctomycetaceae bacterium]|nr:flagellar hook-length control protein FliK [Planctomycetaceae bacterium]
MKAEEELQQITDGYDSDSNGGLSIQNSREPDSNPNLLRELVGSTLDTPANGHPAPLFGSETNSPSESISSPEQRIGFRQGDNPSAEAGTEWTSDEGFTSVVNETNSTTQLQPPTTKPHKPHNDPELAIIPQKNTNSLGVDAQFFQSGSNGDVALTGSEHAGSNLPSGLNTGSHPNEASMAGKPFQINKSAIRDSAKNKSNRDSRTNPEVQFADFATNQLPHSSSPQANEQRIEINTSVSTELSATSEIFSEELLPDSFPKSREPERLSFKNQPDNHLFETKSGQNATLTVPSNHESELNVPDSIKSGQNAENDSIIRQAGDNILKAIEGGKAIRMRMHPPEMGILNIEITSINGSLSARLDVESPHAHRLLVENLPQLQEMLGRANTQV